MGLFKAISLIIFSAVISHFAIVMFWPAPNEDNAYTRVSSRFDANKFYILRDGFGENILQFESHDLLYGICHYDLNDEALILSADIRDGFGILTVYSQAGEVLFSINSRQTLLDKLTIALLPVDAENNLPDGMVFHRIEENKGLIIIRLALSDMSYVDKIEEQLIGAKCQPVKL